VTSNLSIKGELGRERGRPLLGPVRSPFDDTRVGFTATTRINRHDFDVSWNADLRDKGFVVGDDVLITIDVEAERPDDAPGA
jgi:polyisoprenoid-binding protein YceI